MKVRDLSRVVVGLGLLAAVVLWPLQVAWAWENGRGGQDVGDSRDDPGGKSAIDVIVCGPGWPPDYRRIAMSVVPRSVIYYGKILDYQYSVLYILFDRDGDGKMDYGLIDSDGDGQYDTEWRDRNGDGQMQHDETTRHRGQGCIVR